MRVANNADVHTDVQKWQSNMLRGLKFLRTILPTSVVQSITTAVATPAEQYRSFIKSIMILCLGSDDYEYILHRGIPERCSVSDLCHRILELEYH